MALALNLERICVSSSLGWFVDLRFSTVAGFDSRWHLRESAIDKIVFLDDTTEIVGDVEDQSVEIRDDRLVLMRDWDPRRFCP